MRTCSPRRQARVPFACLSDRPALGFTLLELLVVIAIIAILAAVLFPVFASARRKAGEAVCLSNMRQAGMAIALYAQDNDGLYPFAVDPADRDTPQIWNPFPAFKALIPVLPWFHDVLYPYTRSRDIFHCSQDRGIVIEDFTGLELNCLPTCFGKHGTSYLYRTEIAVRGMGDAAFQTPALVNVYMDGSGIWHGSGPDDREIGSARWDKTGPALRLRRFNTLHGDGHVKSLTFRALQALWDTPL